MMNHQRVSAIWVGLICTCSLIWLTGCSSSPSATTSPPTPTLAVSGSTVNALPPGAQIVPQITCEQARQLIEQHKVRVLTLIKDNTGYPVVIDLTLRKVMASSPSMLRNVFVPRVGEQTKCASQLLLAVKTVNQGQPQEQQITVENQAYGS